MEPVAARGEKFIEPAIRAGKHAEPATRGGKYILIYGTCNVRLLKRNGQENPVHVSRRKNACDFRKWRENAGPF